MLHLILGGRRSGKTAFAERCARTACPNGTVPLYIATAEAFDDEMSERIKAHKTSRGDAWRTAEVPLHLDAAIAGLATNDIVVIDCLTVWLTNLMVHDIHQQDAIARLCEALTISTAQIFLVSNETSLGIVPIEPMSRSFLDNSGLLHQKIADIATNVDIVIAGLPLTLKSSS